MERKLTCIHSQFEKEKLFCPFHYIAWE